ncbi:MAG: tRNA(fMet)-specific endonuclease VapC [Candidatus Poribacteria bacterium]|nr:tRNA(fMet)-specific endonuclease VapC [Euryarchaeota archaeon]MDQ1327665.1 tRNA(fMet)-specific endonuclease VapC [Candidatus Poribacteria bacterium]
MYLLDTTHCLGIFFEVPNVKKKFDENRDAGIYTNVIVRSELLYGAYKSEQTLTNLQLIESFLSELRVFDIDRETASICARLRIAILDRFGSKLRSKRRNTTMESLGFKTNDLWIASSAIQYNQILVSADNALWRLDGIEGLKIENW